MRYAEARGSHASCSSAANLSHLATTILRPYEIVDISPEESMDLPENNECLRDDAKP